MLEFTFTELRIINLDNYTANAPIGISKKMKGKMKMKILILAIMLIMSVLLFAEAEDTFNPADQSLLLMPTAQTMPKGSAALTNYVLLFNQLSYALTNRMHITAAMAFPIHKDMIKTFSIGSKLNYVKITDLQAALWNTYNFDSQVLVFGNVFSQGDGQVKFHFSQGMFVNFEKQDNVFFMGGGMLGEISPKTSLILEGVFVPQKSFEIFDDEEIEKDFKMFLLGVRFKGKSIGWDFGAARPLEDTGDLIALPFLKATYMW